MSGQKYNNETIYEYLLGSLPAAEIERFDELSFSDEEFAASLSSAENELVDAYVQGELAGRTLENFNSHYLASPLRRRKVEMARAFQTYAESSVRRAAESSANQAAQAKPTAHGFFSGIKLFNNPFSMWQWGLAAMALALVFLGGWWIFNQRPAPQQNNAKEQVDDSKKEEAATINQGNAPLPKENAQEPVGQESIAVETPTPSRTQKPSTPPQTTIASFVLTPPLRDGGRIQNLSIPAGTGEVMMQLQLESDDYATYSVSLVNQAGVNLWQSGRLRATGKDEKKTLKLRLPAKLLKSEIYSLAVSGISAGGTAEIIGNYPFRSILK